MVLRRKRSLVPDEEGVGGFMEAILAIMIVTSGMVLLTFSFYAISVDDLEDSDLRDRCRALIDLVLEDESILVETGVVRSSSLENIDLSCIDAEGGYKLVIDDIYSGSTVMLGVSGAYIDGEIHSMSVPINVYYSPMDVRPCLLRVWTW